MVTDCRNDRLVVAGHSGGLVVTEDILHLSLVLLSTLMSLFFITSRVILLTDKKTGKNTTLLEEISTLETKNNHTSIKGRGLRWLYKERKLATHRPLPSGSFANI